MNNEINSSRSQWMMWALSLVAFVLIFFQPESAMGQSVSGSGTTNQIPKWTSSSAIGNSVITELPSGYVGIGTNNPQYPLHVVGNDGASVFARLITASVSTPQSAVQLGLSGGTMQAGGGPSFLFFSDNSAHEREFMGRVTAVWENPTDGVEAAGLAFNVRANAADLNAQTEAMRITSGGNVGIGTASPAEKLQIGAGANVNMSLGTSSNNKGFLGTFGDVFTLGINRRLTDGVMTDTTKTHAEIEIFSGNADSKIVFLTASANNTLATERLRITKNGDVGLGTATPLSLLHVGGGSTAPVTTAPGLIVEPNATSAASVVRAGSGATPGELFTFADNSNGLIGTASNHPLGLRTNNVNRVWIDTSGKVGIGTTSPQKTLDVNGDINASGTISGGNVIAKYQDVAEWVPARHAIPAGTVVTLDPEQSNHVLASSRAYDTRVAGVVSAKPGVILGEGGEGKVMVATTGRVRVRVDATNGPIRVGDLLVTSDKPGIAMKSQPLDLGGTPIHRPGTLIGKALEPLEKGVGEILVLLSLQ